MSLTYDLKLFFSLPVLTVLHYHKIGEFRYTEIKDLVNNIKNDIISEISAKKSLNALNETKNAGMIKYKKRTPRQKEL